MLNILVLCTGNSARSVLLECILNDLGAGRVRAFSAGSQPKGDVHPQTLALLARKGLPTEGLRSKSWDEFAGPDAQKMDAVVTVCGSAAAEACPMWPGTPVRGHWGVEDPAAAPEDQQEQAFEAAYSQLRSYAKSFLALPVETMDAEAMTRTLRWVGSN